MLLATAGYYWGLGILYLVLLVTTGILTIRNRHIWLFVFGFFFPILWIIGAIMRPNPSY